MSKSKVKGNFAVRGCRHPRGQRLAPRVLAARPGGPRPSGEGQESQAGGRVRHAYARGVLTVQGFSSVVTDRQRLPLFLRVPVSCLGHEGV